MNKEIKFDRNYLKLLIDNKDKLIEVPINDVKLILTYCEILLDRQDKTIEYIKEHSEMTDLQICGIENVLAFRGSATKLLELLGDKENE